MGISTTILTVLTEPFIKKAVAYLILMMKKFPMTKMGILQICPEMEDMTEILWLLKWTGWPTVIIRRRKIN
jgi:hypothetical protein